MGDTIVRLGVRKGLFRVPLRLPYGVLLELSIILSSL